LPGRFLWIRPPRQAELRCHAEMNAKTLAAT
jgi:hypothetical protein